MIRPPFGPLQDSCLFPPSRKSFQSERELDAKGSKPRDVVRITRQAIATTTEPSSSTVTKTESAHEDVSPKKSGRLPVDEGKSPNGQQNAPTTLSCFEPVPSSCTSTCTLNSIPAVVENHTHELSELEFLDGQYPSLWHTVAKVESASDLFGFHKSSPDDREKQKEIVLRTAPWKNKYYESSARTAIRRRVSELGKVNPELLSTNSADYNFGKTQGQADDLLNQLNDVFPSKKYSGVVIATRAKTPESLAKKMKKRSPEATIGSLPDTVGARIDSPDLETLGRVSTRLEEHFDGKILGCKDYFENPGENGYRALHYLVETGDRISEIQLSTHSLRASDLATHDTLYKGGQEVSPEAKRVLSESADRAFFLESLNSLNRHRGK